MVRVVQRREHQVVDLKAWVRIPTLTPTDVRNPSWGGTRAHNPWIAGSIPALTTTAEVAQREELMHRSHQVAGSSPALGSSHVLHRPRSD